MNGDTHDERDKTTQQDGTPEYFHSPDPRSP
jgi:hypothetical protein